MSPFRLHRHFPVKPLGADGYQEFCAGTIPVKRVLTLEGRSPIVAVEQSTGVPARLRQAPRRRVSARRSALERRLSGDLAGHYRRPRRTVAGAPRARHRRSTAPGPSAVQAGHAAALVVSRRRRLLRAAAQGTQKIGRRAVYPILGARPDTSTARPAAHPALPPDPDAGSRAARADTRALAIAVTRHVGSGALKDTPGAAPEPVVQRPLHRYQLAGRTVPNRRRDPGSARRPRMSPRPAVRRPHATVRLLASGAKLRASARRNACARDPQRRLESHALCSDIRMTRCPRRSVSFFWRLRSIQHVRQKRSAPAGDPASVAQAAPASVSFRLLLTPFSTTSLPWTVVAPTAAEDSSGRGAVYESFPAVASVGRASRWPMLAVDRERPVVGAKRALDGRKRKRG